MFLYRVVFFLVFIGLLSICAAEEAPSDARNLIKNSPFSKWISTESGFSDTDAMNDFIRSLKSKSKRDVQTSITPLVIVPSLVGSRLQAKLDGSHPNHWFCSSVYDSWFSLWMEKINFYPIFIDCWFDNVQLDYDQASQYQTNKTGVESAIEDFGGVTGIDCLSSDGTFCIWNTTTIILQELGYKVGETLFGAPYDWRTTPVNYFNPNGGYFLQLQNLIEDAYTINNGTKVAVTSLSMGGPVFLSFLNYFVSYEWKQKYLDSFISLDGAFGGSASAAHVLVSSASWVNVFTSETEKFKETLQTFGSSTWMLPWAQVWGNDTTIVQNPSASYSVNIFADMLDAINASDAASMFDVMVEKSLTVMKAPGVTTHIVHGYAVPTPVFMDFNTTDMSYLPVTKNGDGDGTIPVEGAAYLARFNDSVDPVYVYPIKGMIHGSSVHTPEALRILMDVLLN